MAVEGVLIPVYRGETVSITETVTSQDITGWSISFIVRAKGQPVTSLINKTVSSGITLSDPTNGICTIALSSTDTDITEGRYDFSIARTDSGSEAVLTIGDFEVKRNTVLGTRTSSS